MHSVGALGLELEPVPLAFVPAAEPAEPPRPKLVAVEVGPVMAVAESIVVEPGMFAEGSAVAEVFLETGEVEWPVESSPGPGLAEGWIVGPSGTGPDLEAAIVPGSVELETELELGPVAVLGLLPLRLRLEDLDRPESWMGASWEVERPAVLGPLQLDSQGVDVEPGVVVVVVVAVAALAAEPAEPALVPEPAAAVETAIVAGAVEQQPAEQLVVAGG